MRKSRSRRKSSPFAVKRRDAGHVVCTAADKEIKGDGKEKEIKQ